MILEAVGDGAGMGAVVNLKAVSDPIRVQDVMQVARAGAQAVLVTNVDCNCTILS